MRAGEKRSNPAATGGVGGEEVAGARRGQRHVEGLPGFLHEMARALQHGERRVSFVQVADLRLQPQGAQQTPSADPEQQFLLRRSSESPP